MHLFDADLLALQNHLGRGEPLEVSSVEHPTLAGLSPKIEQVVQGLVQ